MAYASSEARNILSAVHGFFSLKQGIQGTLDILRRHQCIQSDPIEVAGRNADLTLQSRVQDYKQDYLHHLLYEKRALFEYYCKMLSILPIETYPVFTWMRTKFSERNAPFFKEHERETSFILKMLEDGPVSSKDIKGWKKVEWWGETALSRVILERLLICGKVMIHHREKAVKYYALTEDLLPGKYSEALEPEECVKGMVRIIVRASRLVSPSRAPEQWFSVGKTKKVTELLQALEKEGDLFTVDLEKYPSLYAPIEDKEIWENPQPPDSDWVRFLAPLDPLNWNRSLFAAVYGMEYSWEIYKKVEDRKYGYYCLPLLFNGSYVGLIEPFFRKRDRTLEIRNFHILDKKIDEKRFKAAFEAELQRFSENLGAEKVEGSYPPYFCRNL